MIVYIVQMEKVKATDTIPVNYRDVDEPHRYVAGVYTNYKTATKAGETEIKWRHGRYTFHIHDCVLDHINTAKIQYEICESNQYGELSPDFEIINIKSKLKNEI